MRASFCFFEKMSYIQPERLEKDAFAPTAAAFAAGHRRCRRTSMDDSFFFLMMMESRWQKEGSVCVRGPTLRTILSEKWK